MHGDMHFPFLPTEVIIPILIPFRAYSDYMVNCDSMKVSVMAMDPQRDDDIYQSEIDMSLQQPPLSMKVSEILRCLLCKNARNCLIEHAGKWQYSHVVNLSWQQDTGSLKWEWLVANNYILFSQ